MNVIARYRMDPFFFRDAPYAVDERQVTFLVQRGRRLSIGTHGISIGALIFPASDVISLTWRSEQSREWSHPSDGVFGFGVCTAAQHVNIRWEAKESLPAFVRGLFIRTSGEIPLSARRREEQHLAHDVVIAALRKFILPTWLARQRRAFELGQDLIIGACRFNADGAHFPLETSSGIQAVSLHWGEFKVVTEGPQTTLSALYDDQIRYALPTATTPNASLLADLWIDQLMLREGAAQPR